MFAPFHKVVPSPIFLVGAMQHVYFEDNVMDSVDHWDQE